MTKTEKKSYQNEFTDSLTFGPGSIAVYSVQIAGTASKADVVRSHEDNCVGKNQQKDEIQFEKGSCATYVLRAEGTVKEAKIVRSHKCSGC